MRPPADRCVAIDNDIHFKDIDPAAFAEMMGERMRFFEAHVKGVTSPIGRGDMDYAVGRAIFAQAARDWLAKRVDDRAAIRTMAANFARLCRTWDDARREAKEKEA